MLNELKKLKYPGRKEELLYFLQEIIGKRDIKLDDIYVLCAHAPAGYQLFPDALIDYCLCFGWINNNETFSINEELRIMIDNAEQINQYMVMTTIQCLFENSVLTAEMFTYDINESKYLFRNERLPLVYAYIRNVLVSQGLFVVNRRDIKPLFFVNPEFENEVAKFCREKAKRYTLEQLKAKMEANAIAGAKAEEYVLHYEKKRIFNPDLCNKIKLISEIDVCAGYDIISFESDLSDCYDRFIEVKAISKNYSFFWSRNEYEVARLKGNQYFLYLVDLKKIHKEEYVPLIIKNPAASIMASQEWLVEPESYHICKV